MWNTPAVSPGAFVVSGPEAGRTRGRSVLKKIKVNGFRSLMGCTVSVRPGVNILLGPNGSGKSNILMFLAFVSAMFERQSASVAVSDFGGVGKIFSRSGKHNIWKRIDAELTGDGSYRTYQDDGIEVLSNYWYEYRFSINFSEDIETVYFGEQDFKFSVSNGPSNSRSTRNGDWDVHIKQSASIVDNIITDSYTVHEINLKLIDELLVKFITQIANEEEDGDTKRAFVRLLQQDHHSDIPIVHSAGDYIHAMRGVITDFLKNNVMDIVPSMAKNTEDSATPPGVKENGQGLAATLYALDRAKKDIEHPIGQSAIWPTLKKAGSLGYIPIPNAFDMIEEATKSVNDNILSIHPEKDNMANSITVYIYQKSDVGNVKLPLSLFSDGIVKWLALVTSIITNRSIFAIEEPENYIHPLMQKKILDLLRENLRAQGEGGNPRGSLFLTTHSETLLNSADPSEIIVVSMTDSGATKTRRLRRTKDIRDAVNQNGFGLGYLYLSGVLQDA